MKKILFPLILSIASNVAWCTPSESHEQIDPRMAAIISHYENLVKEQKNVIAEQHEIIKQYKKLSKKNKNKNVHTSPISPDEASQEELTPYQVELNRQIDEVINRQSLQTIVEQTH